MIYFLIWMHGEGGGGLGGLNQIKQPRVADFFFAHPLGWLKGFGPMLLIILLSFWEQILNIEVKEPLPFGIKSYILDNIFPQLPRILQQPIRPALDTLTMHAQLLPTRPTL